MAKANENTEYGLWLPAHRLASMGRARVWMLKMGICLAVAALKIPRSHFAVHVFGDVLGEPDAPDA